MAALSNDLIGPPELEAQLQRRSTAVTRAKGAILFRRGDAVQGVFLVLQGAVSLSLDDGCLVYPARVLGPGSIIGLPATVAGAPYSLTAEVVEDAELAFVDRESILECLRSHPDLCLQVMDLLGNEIAGVRSALKLVDVGRPGH